MDITYTAMLHNGQLALQQMIESFALAVTRFAVHGKAILEEIFK